MPLRDQVLPYIKASAAGEAKPVLALDAEDSPIFVPYIGSLLISYIVDEGSYFRYVSDGERRSADLSLVDLRRAAEANLKAKIASTGVRLLPYGRCLAVLFEGNFEATLLLWDGLVAHAREHLGPELIAAAPARDILALSSPAGADELRAVIGRAWPGGDHLLTQDLYRYTERGWAAYLVS